MAAPTFDSGDVLESGTGTINTSFDVDHQAYNSGDLIIQYGCADDGSVTITPPSSGVNSEALEFTAIAGTTGDPAIAIIAWVATSTETTGSQAWTTSAVNTGWSACSLVIPAGEFNATTPIDSTSPLSGSAFNSTTLPSPTWTGVAAGGRAIVFAGIDSDPATSVDSGHTLAFTGDESLSGNRINTAIAYRDSETTLAQSIPSYNFSVPGNDTGTTVGLVVNGPAASGGSPIPVIQPILTHIGGLG